MVLHGLQIGFALTGSYCTLEKVLPQVEELVQMGAEVFPIVSSSISSSRTRFGEPAYWLNRLREITKKKEISTIAEAEPIGPKSYLDIIVVAPCTGNTLAKLAHGIVDSPVLMALKAQLRNQKPVVLAISTNDGLSMNARNLGLLLNTRNIYFVPFGQDNPEEKQNSLVAHMDRIPDTIIAALEGRQPQPLLVEYK